MKKIKNWLTITFLTLFVQFSYSQKSDYIATDSSFTSGIKLLQGTSRENAQFIRLKRKNREVRYYPDQLSEYGFKNGTKYFSREIIIDGDEKLAFLEVLEQGIVTLYYYEDKKHKTFFIEKDSILAELKKDKEAFKALSKDCEFISDGIKLASYSRKSMKKLVSDYNECKRQPFPYSKIGIAAGIKSTTLDASDLSNPRIEKINFSPSNSMYLGVYADFPIEMSHLSFNTGLFFTKTGFSENSIDSQSDTDVVINLTSINTPILLRYTIPTTRIRPFFELGGQLIYHFENSSEVYNSTIDDDIIIINTPNLVEPLVADYIIGYMIGGGLQYNIDYRKTLSFELRQSTSYDEDGSSNMKGLDFLIGFTF